LRREAAVLTKETYHHGDLKAELIKKGLKILDEEGYEAFSMRKVAKACNVSQTAPYRHFKDKNDLIKAIAVTALQEFNQSLEKAFSEEGDPKNQLKAMGRYYISFFAENPEYMRLLFFSNAQAWMREAVMNECQSEDEHPYSALEKAVRNYKAACPDDERSEEELIVYCWGLVHGIAVLMVNGELPSGEDAMALVERVVQSERFL
jgi:AcrR family transcriptional regulator